MNTTAPAKAPKQKRHDALVARVTVTIPLATNMPESYADAVKAVESIKTSMPTGATVKIETSLAKV